jgi:hypothetical protein
MVMAGATIGALALVLPLVSRQAARWVTAMAAIMTATMPTTIIITTMAALVTSSRAETIRAIVLNVTSHTTRRRVRISDTMANATLARRAYQEERLALVAPLLIFSGDASEGSDITR